MDKYCKNKYGSRRISVITSYYIYNYGSVLQAYATKVFFEQMGYEVEFVNYIRENVRNRVIVNQKWSTSRIRKAVYGIYQKIDMAKKRKVFLGYILKRLQLSPEYSDRNQLYKNPPKADVYCVGSDQMWNSEYNGGILSENFLDFAPVGSKKISFSSSMGMSVYSEEEMNQMKAYLEDFLFVSVREKEAAEILSAVGVENVYLLLDPTLLISAEVWKKEMSPKCPIRGKYIFIYQLNNNPEMLQLAMKLAGRDNLKIIQITYYLAQKIAGVHCVYCPEVSEFLSLLYHAEYVVTDSFHGTAFSINLNKNFYAFNPPEYASRIKSILNILGLDTRLVDEIQRIDLDQTIDYAAVNKILEKERANIKTLISILSE